MAHLLKLKIVFPYVIENARLYVNNMPVTKSEILKLYKNLLRESSKFPIYNYRMYALRRIKDTFKESRSIENSIEIEASYKKGLENLEIIKRQVIVSSLYKPEKLVIE